MQRTITSVLVALVLVSAGCGDAAKESTGASDNTADAILMRAVESMGGDQALAGIRGVRFEAAGTYKKGEMESPYTAEITWVWPDRGTWTVKAQMMTASMGMDGDLAWSKMMAPVARAAGPALESFREWPVHQDIMMVRPLLHRTDVNRRLGAIETEMEGVKTETVYAEFDEFGKFALHFETKDGKTFLSQVTGPQTMPDGRKGTMKWSLSEPKTFGDVTMPSAFTMETRVGDKIEHSTREKVTAVEWNPVVTDETFAMPKLEMELDTVIVKDVPAGLGLVVVHEGPYENLAGSFAKAFGKAAETGCLFMPQATCIYLNDPAKVSDPKDLRTEIIVGLMPMGPPPTAAPEGAELRQMPAVKVAAMTVRGPYGSHEDKSIAAVMEWCVREKKTPAGTPRMVYMHAPATTLAEDQVAQVQVPITE